MFAPHLLACGGGAAAVSCSREEIFVHATDHIANDSVSVFIQLREIFNTPNQTPRSVL